MRNTTVIPVSASIVLLFGAFMYQRVMTGEEVYLPPDHAAGFGTPYPPAKGESYVDPVFGTSIWRVTDALADGYEFITAEYSNGQHFNADETLLRLVGQLPTGGYHVLFVEPTPPFTVERVAAGLASSNPSDFYWHPSDPDTLYHIAYEDFMVYDLASGESRVLHHFEEYGSITGAGEAQMSLDGDRIALLGTELGSFEPLELFVYELSTDSKIAAMPIPPGFDSVRMAPSGAGIVVQGRGAHYYELRDGRLAHLRELSADAGHSDIGLGPDGHEYLFYVRSTFDNQVYATRLDGGGTTMILPIGGRGMWPGVHVTANSSQHDGWVYVVTYADAVPDNDPTQGWQPFMAEVIRAQYDGSGWERLAHTRTGGYPDERFGAYWGSTARGSVSHSGRFVVWSANFNRQATEPATPPDYTDVYLLEAPAADPAVNRRP